MLTDLALAILHHVVVFSIFAVYAVRVAFVRPGLDGEGTARLAKFDAAYGGLAMLALVVGFARVFLGLKGWDYYGGYWVFWAKVASFVLVGLFSIKPTLRFQKWRKANQPVSSSQIALVRPWLRAEGAALLAILVFAAMMARGVGY